MDTAPDVLEDPDQLWSRYFWAYLDDVERVPDDWSAIKWWGVSVHIPNLWSVITITSHCAIQINSSRYHPTWASLARDYLSIMSSSVSSERAFSQGGITISKRRNRLNGDIVEALQCVKCEIRHDLLFQEPAPSLILEAQYNDDGDSDDGEDDGEETRTAQAWDELLEDEDDGRLNTTSGMNTEVEPED